MNPLRGPILMVASMAFFAVEDALIKALVQGGVPAGEVALVLGFGGALVFAIIARARGSGLFVPAAIRGAALLRNSAETGAAMCMILGVALVPLGTVSAILQAMPLAVTMGAALFLGEPVGWRRWSAIALGFAGVLVIVRPWAASFDHLALIPLGAVVLLSTRDIATKRVAPGITSLQLSGWGFLAVIPGGLLLLLLRGEGLIWPDAVQGALLVINIAVGIAGYGLLVLATRAGDFALTTPFRYARLVFAMLLGIIVFGERPDAMTLLGAAIVVGAGLYTLMREMRLWRR